jgi:peroxiredoxin
VGISIDEVDRTKRLARELGLAYPLLSNPNRDVIEAYGVLVQDPDLAWPSVFLVSPKFEVVWRTLSTTYRQRPSADFLIEVVEAYLSGSPLPEAEDSQSLR